MTTFELRTTDGGVELVIPLDPHDTSALTFALDMHTAMVNGKMCTDTTEFDGHTHICAFYSDHSGKRPHQCRACPHTWNAPPITIQGSTRGDMRSTSYPTSSELADLLLVDDSSAAYDELTQWIGRIEGALQGRSISIKDGSSILAELRTLKRTVEEATKQ